MTTDKADTKPTEDEFLAGKVLTYKGFDENTYTVQVLRDRSRLMYMEFCDVDGKVLRRPITSESGARTFYMNHELAKDFLDA